MTYLNSICFNNFHDVVFPAEKESSESLTFCKIAEIKKNQS